MINVTVNRAPEYTVEGLKQSVLSQEVTVRPYNRHSQDLTNWRNATKAAEAMIPRRVTLYDLYHDITTTDAQIIAVWGKREDAITSADWYFTDKTGKPVDEINELIDCIGFSELLKEIIKTKAWGYTMVEPRFFINDNDQNEMALWVAPPKNIRPDLGIVANDQTSDSGTNIREGIYAKTVMEVGDPKDLGLLLSAAQYAILKRGDISDWAEFIEIFGRGIIDATWDGFDESQRIKLAKSLSEMGGGGVLVRPAGTTVDIKNNNGNANGQLQDAFATKMDGYISKALLGTTETTDSSKTSGYAQSETHQKENSKKFETDIQFVRRILNSRFTKILKAAGFDTKGGTFVLKTKTELTKKERFDIAMKMLEKGIPVSDDYFYENFEVDKPADYNQLKAEAKAKSEEIKADTPPTSEEKPKDKKAKTAKDQPEEKVKLSDIKIVRKLLNGLGFFQAALANGSTRANSQICQCGAVHTITLSDQDKPEFDEDQMIQRFWDAGGTLAFDTGLFHLTSQTLLNGLKKGWSNKTITLVDIGFDYGMDDPAMLTSFEMNLHRFSASKSLAEAQKLNELFRNAKDFEQFYMNAKLQLEVFNKEWLATEYTTALLTGEAAATYNRLMQNIDVFPYWKYKTVGDDRVRPEHRLLDDLILPANDPRWRKIFPPNGWKCRCYVVGVMAHEIEGVDLQEMRKRADSFMVSEEFSRSAATGWGVNRADAGEVFTANQFYIKKFPGKSSKDLDNLKPSDYELKSYSQAKKAATEEMPKFEGNPEFFLDENRDIRDYHNRSILLDRARFNAEEQGEQSFRSELLNAVKSTLKRPNEVWINGSNYDEFITIKYFLDQTIVVASRVKNGKVYEIDRWFTLEEKKDLIEKYRRGLLIFNKP